MKYKKIVTLVGLVVILGSFFFWKTRKSVTELTLSDFEFLEPGMSLDEIVARVGEPNRDVGSGFYMPVYDLADGGVVGLQFGGDPNNLLIAEYRSRDGKVKVLVNGQE